MKEGSHHDGTKLESVRWREDTDDFRNHNFLKMCSCLLIALLILVSGVLVLVLRRSNEVSQGKAGVETWAIPSQIKDFTVMIMANVWSAQVKREIHH